MKISIVQTFLLVVVAILGLAAAETQSLRGANVESVANVADLKNERLERNLQNVNTNFGADVEEFSFGFNLQGILNFLVSVFSAGFSFNFNFNDCCD